MLGFIHESQNTANKKLILLEKDETSIKDLQHIFCRFLKKVLNLFWKVISTNTLFTEKPAYQKDHNSAYNLLKSKIFHKILSTPAARKRGFYSNFNC